VSRVREPVVSSGVGTRPSWTHRSRPGTNRRGRRGSVRAGSPVHTIRRVASIPAIERPDHGGATPPLAPAAYAGSRTLSGAPLNSRPDGPLPPAPRPMRGSLPPGTADPRARATADAPAAGPALPAPGPALRPACPAPPPYAARRP